MSESPICARHEDGTKRTKPEDKDLPEGRHPTGIREFIHRGQKTLSGKAEIHKGSSQR